MSLIKCPECDNQISDRSYSCPYCGYPLRENASSDLLITKNTSLTGEQSATKRINKKALIALLGIVVLAGIILSIFFLKKPAHKPTDPIVGSWFLIGYGEGDFDTDSLVYAEEGQCSIVFNSSGSGLLSLDNKGETTEFKWEITDNPDSDSNWYIICLGEDQRILAANLTFTEGEASNILMIGTGEIMMLFGQSQS